MSDLLAQTRVGLAPEQDHVAEKPVALRVLVQVVFLIPFLAFCAEHTLLEGKLPTCNKS